VADSYSVAQVNQFAWLVRGHYQGTTSYAATV